MIRLVADYVQKAGAVNDDNEEPEFLQAETVVKDLGESPVACDDGRDEHYQAVNSYRRDRSCENRP